MARTNKDRNLQQNTWQKLNKYRKTIALSKKELPDLDKRLKEIQKQGQSFTQWIANKLKEIELD